MEKDETRKFDELLTRGVEEVIDRPNLEKKLKSGKKLRVKLGTDPTSPNVHLGRSIPLLKLRDFQKLGHQVVFIVGDFTGVIGDTSDKDSERPMLSKETIAVNLKTYIEQISKIIDISKTEIHYNSKWLSKLNYDEITQQANIFSLNEFISRDNISRRLKAGKRVSLRELLYPLMQGYDSVVVKADVEIGGSDQRFNLLSGRDIQKSYQQEPQDIITNPLIEGLDGRKMSSSFGNTVNLLDTPNDMFGKIMTLNDEFIIKYFTLLTRVDRDIVLQHEADLNSGKNPRDVKMQLAFEIVRMYHNASLAEAAKSYFTNTFSSKNTPSDITEFKPSDYNIVSVLVESKLVSSKSEARRVIEQGGVKVNEEKIESADHTLSAPSTLQKGKLNFLKII